MALRRIWYLTFVLCCAATLPAGAQKPAVSEVLKAAADYLPKYAEKIGVLAAEEDYIQREPTSGSATRRLHSDFAFVGFDQGMVRSYRDVFSIDTKTVRQRDDRLLKLFQGSVSDSAQQQGAAFADEGVRQYLSPNLRMFDDPTMALEFLRPDNQPQSDFSVDSVKTMDGAQVAILKFKEGKGANVLSAPEGSSASGRFWVDVATGAVRQSELVVSSKSFMFKVTVKYALDPGLGLWLPVEAIQLADVTQAPGGLSTMGAGGLMGQRQSLEGRASYSKFRR